MTKLNRTSLYIKTVSRLVIVLTALFSNQNADGKVRNTTFGNGESVTFNAYYNWGPLWLNAGVVNFTVHDSMYLQRPSYFIKAVGRTHPKYDSFFQVRDTFEVFVEPDDLRALAYHRSTYEGSNNMQVWYETDLDSMRMYATKKEPNQALRKDTFAIFPNSYDVLSAIYAVRNFDFEAYEPGQTIPFKLWVDMGYFDIYVRYRGIEEVKLKNGRKFSCLVFSPLLVEGTLFRDGEGMKVYVTNDRNRVPVYIEAKIIVGKVKAILSSTENLKYPIESEIF